MADLDIGLREAIGKTPCGTDRHCDGRIFSKEEKIMKAYIRDRCRAALTRVLNRFRNGSAAALDASDEGTDWLGIG